MLNVDKTLPKDPDELRQFTALLLAEVKSQAVLIEKLRHQLAGHRNHRFGSSSESIEQLQLALETSEIAVAKMTAKLRLPDEGGRINPSAALAIVLGPMADKGSPPITSRAWKWS